jgi:hypothetical protein
MALCGVEWRCKPSEREDPMSLEHEIKSWLATQLPAALMAAPPEASVYDDELIIVLHALAPEAFSADDEARHSEERRLIAQLREESRPLRMRLADTLQARYQRPVAWGVRLGESEALFTARTAPVMTRLDRREREVLDTLVAAGVAETRSAALAYCVRVFAAEHADWLAELRGVVARVQAVRERFSLRRRQGRPPYE